MNFRYLKIVKSPTPELLKILNNNVIGTPGYGMLYQHTGVKNKINQIEDPYFVNLVRAGHIAGTCCFCSRITFNNNLPIRSFYIRYFSFREIFRRKSIKEKKQGSTSGIRKEVESLLSGNGLGVNPSEKFFSYAYVDPRNIRSALLCKEFGFETVREYTTVIFSRINPKENQKNKIIEVEFDESVKELLKGYYQNYNALSFENLSGRRYYFILNDEGERVAGVQVSPNHWKIHSLPGLKGKLILNLFTHLPILNKLINRNYLFLTFEGVYLKPGFERHLEILFESLLAQYHFNSAICLVDANTKLYTTLKSLNLGLINKLNKEVRGNVICRFTNFSNTEKEQFKTNPMYLSGIDAT